MRLIAYILIAVTLAAWPSLAAEDASTAPKLQPSEDITIASVDRLVELLSADRFDVRDDAMTQLMLRENLTDEQLGAALRANDDPERRHRLTRVALQRFYDAFNPGQAPRDQGPGALGIISISNSNVVRPTHDPRLKRPAMIVSQTRPGFPAYVHLRPGDLIIGLGGQLFDDSIDQNEFSNTIQRYRAGEVLEIALLRHGKRVDVSLRLDSLQRLHDVHQYLAQYPQVQLDPRWRSHLSRLYGDEPIIKTIVLDAPDDAP